MSQNQSETRFLTNLPKPSSGQVLFVALGGVGEIGMNVYLYGIGGKWLMIDCGVSFGTPFTPGADVLVPDLTVVESIKKDLVGLVITHGHEDHLGAVGYLYDELECPVFATPFTAALLNDKLTENGLEPNSVITKVDIGGRIEAGPFDIEFVPMAHSIPEPSAIALHTKLGVILHTGDWKTDTSEPNGYGVDKPRLTELGEQGVYAVVADSTNVLTERDAGTEASAREGLKKVIESKTGRVVVACFATNFRRVKSLIEIAEETGRHVAVAGRSMRRIIRVAKETGYLHSSFEVVSETDLDFLPRERVLLLCTGSQGEPRAALTRIAVDGNRNIKLQEGDTVIYSSRIIPGNELEIFRTQNKLADKGIEVITDSDAENIHVSGHPGRREMREVYSWLKPQHVIPVHGEARHLHGHADLAKEIGSTATLVKNGEILAMTSNASPEMIGACETGKLAIEGERYVDIYGEMMRERRKIMQAGLIIVSVVVDSAGRLATAPNILSQGVLELPEEQDLVDEASDYVGRLMGKLKKHEREDKSALAEALRVKVRRFFKDEIGTKPIVSVQVVEL